jgi:tRNA C32,U32 (ribose-2'-O)-methylase TrmJ
MIMAYEWRIAHPGRMEQDVVMNADHATAGERQGLVEHMERVLLRIGFVQAKEHNILPTLIDVLSRMDLTSREVAIVRGILSLTERNLDGIAGSETMRE